MAAAPEPEGGRELLSRRMMELGVTANRNRGLGISLVAWLVMKAPAQKNDLAVVPARWTFLDPVGLDAADEQVAEAVTREVANRGKVPVIGWPSILQFRSAPKLSPEVAKATGAAMIMAISVRAAAGQSRVTVFLVEPHTGRKRWAEDFYAQDLGTPEAVGTLAKTIAHDLEIALGVSDRP